MGPVLPTFDTPLVPRRIHVGGAVGREAPYVQREADVELVSQLRAGRFCHVLAPRQMGKSSLRVRAQIALRSHHIRPAVVDLNLTGAGSATPQQWYRTLSRKVTESLDLPSSTYDTFWTANAGLSPLTCFLDFLRDVIIPASPEPLVLFIDEIQAVLMLDFDADELFAGLRALRDQCAERDASRTFTVCLLGVAAPGSLVRDSNLSPFNISRGIELEDFTRVQLDVLRGVLEGVQGDPGKKLTRVHEMTHGHPYMTARLVDALTEWSGSGADDAADVDQLCSEIFLRGGRVGDTSLTEMEKAFRPTVRDGDAPKRTRLSFERPAGEMLRLYRAMREGKEVAFDDNDRVQLALRLTGIAARRGNKLEIRNEIVRRLFDLEWVRQLESERVVLEPMTHWLASGRQRRDLLTGAALRQAEAWALTRPEMSPEERQYLTMSSQEERGALGRRSRWLLGGSMSLLTALGVAIGVSYTGVRAARLAEEQANEKTASAEAKKREVQDALEKERTFSQAVLATQQELADPTPANCEPQKLDELRANLAKERDAAKETIKSLKQAKARTEDALQRCYAKSAGGP